MAEQRTFLSSALMGEVAKVGGRSGSHHPRLLLKKARAETSPMEGGHALLIMGFVVHMSPRLHVPLVWAQAYAIEYVRRPGHDCPSMFLEELRTFVD